MTGKRYKPSIAAWRLVRYMVANECSLRRHGWSGFTDDTYQWPIVGAVLQPLIDNGWLVRDPTSNQHEIYLVPVRMAEIIKEEQ